MRPKLWLHPFLSPPTFLSYQRGNQSDSRAPGLPKTSADRSPGVPWHRPLAESRLLSYEAALPHLFPPTPKAQCQSDGGASCMPSQGHKECMASPRPSQSQQET